MESAQKAKASQSSSSDSSSEESSSTSSKKDRKSKKPYAELYDYRQLNSKILDQEKAGIVFYVSTSNLTHEVPLFDKIFQQVNGPFNIGVFYVNQSAEDY